MAITPATALAIKPASNGNTFPVTWPASVESVSAICSRPAPRNAGVPRKKLKRAASSRRNLRTNPAAMVEMVRAVNEAYLEIAVDTQTDMIFMLENFCGHGFKAGDPMAPCYRGPDQENYFDLTCIHPTPKGHGVITDLFTAVIDE